MRFPFFEVFLFNRIASADSQSHHRAYKKRETYREKQKETGEKMFGFSRTNSHEHLDQMFDYLLHIFMTKQAMCRSRNERIKGLFFFLLHYFILHQMSTYPAKEKKLSGISFQPCQRNIKKQYQRITYFFQTFRFYGFSDF